MEPVSNTTRLVALLRQRLTERARVKSNKGPSSKNAESAGQSMVQALVGVEGLDERHLKRALIQDILSEQFGPEMLNQAKFQQVVDNVTATLEDDPGASAVLAQVVSDLRAAAR